MKANELLAKGEQSFSLVDVRTEAEYHGESIAGAKSLPVHEFTTLTFTELLGGRETDAKEVVLICQSDTRAYAALKKLDEGMREKVHVLEGGMVAWKQAGGAVEEGEGPAFSLERQMRIAAGLVIVFGVVLGYVVNAYFFLLSGAVGMGLIFAGITDN